MSNQASRSYQDMDIENPTEKDFGATPHDHLHGDMDSDTALRRIRTAGSISISPELFEKIYLSPQNQVKGELRKTFGNPTPLCLVGFLLALTPLSCDLMGWRGAGDTGSGSAGIGAYFFFGGLLMTLGAIGEWIVGNTFPFVVFGSFGAFWLTFAAILDPTFGSWSNYATSATNPASGLEAPSFNAALGFFLLWMGVLCLVYMVCALRTNIVFVCIFFTLVLAFGFLTATYWYLAHGDVVMAGRLRIGGGACSFVTCLLGWYIFSAIMLASLDFPLQLPVGDLSTMIKGASQKKEA